MKEGGDSPAGVHAGAFVVAKAGPADDGPAQQLEEEVLMVVHEAMARIGVFQAIVGDESAIQLFPELIGHALFPFGLTAVAAHDRTGGLEKVIEVLGQRAAVVDAGDAEAVAADQ